jgi:thioredoxin 1
VARYLWQGSARATPPAPSSGHTLIYFWGPRCAACASAKPIIAELVRASPWLRLRDIDATAQPHEAQKWGVLTLPTLILLDDTGRIAYRACGAISPRRLHDEVRTHCPRSAP